MNGISSAATKSLTIRYMLALVAIATTCLASQLVIQSLLAQAQSHAQSVNIAGRQRMLSQRIAKLVHQVAAAPHSADRDAWLSELRISVNDFVSMQDVIQQGDADLGIPPLQVAAVSDELYQLRPLVAAISSAAGRLLEGSGANHPDTLAEVAQQIRDAEAPFLLSMDRVVSLLSAHSQSSIGRLMFIEQLITCSTLLLLLLEAIFVFRPAVQRTGDAIYGLRIALSQARSATHNAELAISDRNVALSAAAMDLKRLSAEIDSLLLEQIATVAPRDGHRCRILVTHIHSTLAKLTDLAMDRDHEGEDLVVSRTSPRTLVTEAVETFRRRTGEQAEVEVTMDVRLPASLLVDEQLFHDSIVYLLQSVQDAVGASIKVHLGYDDRELQLIVDIVAARDEARIALEAADNASRGLSVATYGDRDDEDTPSSVSEVETLDLLLAKRSVERLGGTVLASLQRDQVTVRLPLDETKRMTLVADAGRLQNA